VRYRYSNFGIWLTYTCAFVVEHRVIARKIEVAFGANKKTPSHFAEGFGNSWTRVSKHVQEDGARNLLLVSPENLMYLPPTAFVEFSSLWVLRNGSINLRVICFLFRLDDALGYNRLKPLSSSRNPFHQVRNIATKDPFIIGSYDVLIADLRQNSMSWTLYLIVKVILYGIRISRSIVVFDRVIIILITNPFRGSLKALSLTFLIDIKKRRVGDLSKPM